jgi:hypothetical protein
VIAYVAVESSRLMSLLFWDSAAVSDGGRPKYEAGEAPSHEDIEGRIGNQVVDRQRSIGSLAHHGVIETLTASHVDRE